MPEISVIMLTYNREKFVERAIKSIMRQTWSDFELIIVDNGSTDKSGELCDKWAEIDTRVKVIHKKKGNIGSGRNSGLDKAIGNYITFVDDDDRFEPDMLMYLFKLIKKYNGDIAICGSMREFENRIEPKYVFEKTYILNKREAIREMLRRKLFNSGMPTKLMKKEICNNIRFPENGKYDDISTCYRYIAEAESIIVGGQPKYYCYRHNCNNSDFTTNDKLLSRQQLCVYLKSFRERTEYLSKIIPDDADYYLYAELSYMISMCNKLKRLNYPSDCKEIYGYMSGEIQKREEWLKDTGYLEEYEKQWIKEIV